MNVNVWGANNVNFRFNDLERDFGLRAFAEGGIQYSPNRSHIGNFAHTYTIINHSIYEIQYTEARLIDNMELWNSFVINTDIGSNSKVAAFGFQLKCIITNFDNIRQGNNATLVWTRVS